MLYVGCVLLGFLLRSILVLYTRKETWVAFYENEYHRKFFFEKSEALVKEKALKFHKSLKNESQTDCLLLITKVT